MKYLVSECTGGLGDLLSRYFSVRAIGADQGYETLFYNFNKFASRCENELNINTEGWRKIFIRQDLFKENFDLSGFSTINFPLEFESIVLEGEKIILDGYPFSFDYFLHKIDDISKEINIPNNTNFNFSNNDLVINTRRKEWPTATTEFIDLCFTDYYFNIIKMSSPDRVIIVSDDIPWTIEWYESQIYNKIKVPFTFYQDIPIKQFEFLIKAPKLAICQSSFSRWAGIFNKNIVFSPLKWYRTVDKKVDTMNLENWIKVYFNYT